MRILKKDTVVTTDVEKYKDQRLLIKGNTLENGLVWYFVEREDHPGEGLHKLRYDRIFPVEIKSKFLVAYQRMAGTTVFHQLIDAASHQEVVDMLGQLAPDGHTIIILAIVEINPT